MTIPTAFVLLIRHGENDWVGTNRLAGRTPGVHLNDKGRELTDKLTQRLAGQPVSAIYSSPMERCMETARPLATTLDLDIRPREGVIEVDFGEWQDKTLKQTICDLVEDKTGNRPTGPIRLLTHLRYFGYVFNPVSFYYCFDKDGSQLETIVAEVNNTPWGERHLYVLPGKDNVADGRHMRFKREKQFHVSPFMPMDIQYDWLFSAPGKTLSVYMENYQTDEKIFDATLGLKRKSINASSCATMLSRYPFMTAKVIVAIYWQALKLLIKKSPVFDHPDKINYAERGADKA